MSVCVCLVIRLYALLEYYSILDLSMLCYVHFYFIRIFYRKKNCLLFNVCIHFSIAAVVVLLSISFSLPYLLMKVSHRGGCCCCCRCRYCTTYSVACYLYLSVSA